MTVLELQSGTKTPELRTQRSQGRSVEDLRTELDGYLEEMSEFPVLMPEDVFLKLSAWTARATELKILLTRSDRQVHRAFLTKELEPFIDECERQFKFHSRIQTIREFEFKSSGGQV